MDTTDLVRRVHERRALPAPAARRAIRLAAGLVQADIAKTVGVSQQTVAAWEADTRTPSGEHVAAYLEVLKELQQAMAA